MSDAPLYKLVDCLNAALTLVSDGHAAKGYPIARVLNTWRHTYEDERTNLLTRLRLAEEANGLLERTIEAQREAIAESEAQRDIASHNALHFAKRTSDLEAERDEARRRIAELEATTKQQDSDWLAMLRAISTLADRLEADKAEPDNEWCKADDATLLEQFDPWQTLRELEAAQGWEPVPDGVYGDAQAPGGVGWRVVDGMAGCAPMDANRMFCGKLPDDWQLMRRKQGGD